LTSEGVCIKIIVLVIAVSEGRTMNRNKSTFALYFGNRGFFPASLLASARQEMLETMEKLGHDYIILDASATRNGGVETAAEGATYARFLKENEGKFDGVILSLPNFGDENGAVAALRDANVPILIQAYPDELNRMAPALRRDSFCGKMSIMDVFVQNDIPFTVLKPHTVSPTSRVFAEHIDHFDRVCRVIRIISPLRLSIYLSFLRGCRTSPNRAKYTYRNWRI
jgi:L-fucose isomerase-like protein